MARARSSHLRLAAIVATVCAAPAAARADAVAAQAEGGYTSSSITTGDSTGQEVRSDSEAWSQRYRLNLDETIFPLVKFGAGGLLDWNIASSKAAGVRSDTDSKTWDGNAHLTFGDPMLSGGLDYDRREEDIFVRSPTFKGSQPGLVRETYGASGSWRPLDLPSLDLRLSRSHAFDTAHRSLDVTASDATLTSGFDPTPTVDLRYTARYGTNEDALTGVHTNDVSNTGSVRWSDRFLDGRVTAYAGYNLSTRNSFTTVPGTTGTVATQKFPVAGLSIVDGPIDTPTRITLNQNPALIDGITGNGTPGNGSAGVNLGFNASAGAVSPTLVTYRELGAQLPNVVTEVTRIDVWVDRNVEPVAGQFTWIAYQSDDNVTWTELDRAATSSTYDPLQNRFQISIPATKARYLKVVTKPIIRGLTTDPLFADIFVTELQLFDVVDATLVRGRTFQLAGSLNGTVRVQLLKSPSLAYDFSGLLSHSTSPSLVTYGITNGLSAQHRWNPRVSGAARAERSDTDAGLGHDASNRWAGTLTFDVLPTLSATLGYSGQYGQHPKGNSLGHSATAFARADVYEGVSLSTTSSASWSRAETGQVSRSVLASGSASLVPNKIVTTSASGSWSYTTQTGGGLPEQTDHRGVLEANASVTPFPALAVSGGVVRLVARTGSTTLLNVAGSASPLRGGDLVLTYAYTESLDLGSQTHSRTHGPSLRWNIRQGWFMNANYSFQRTTSPVQWMKGQALSANLVITYR